MVQQLIEQNITLIMSSFLVASFILGLCIIWLERTVFVAFLREIKRPTYAILLILMIGYVVFCGLYGLNFTGFEQASHEWEAFGKAKRIAAGDRTVFNEILHGLGYPLLVAIPFKLFGVNPVAAAVINLILATFSILLVFILGRLIFDNDLVGLAAALLYALNPMTFSFTAHQMGEPTTIAFLLLLTVIVGVFAFRQHNMRLHIATVSLIAASAQFRLEYIILIVPYVLYFLLTRRPVRSGLGRLIALLLLFIILSTPALALNSKLKESYSSGWAGSTQAYDNGREYTYSLPLADQLDTVLKPLTNNAFSFSFMIYDLPNFYAFWSSKYFLVLSLFIIVGIAVSLRRMPAGGGWVLLCFFAVNWVYLTASVHYESRFAVATLTLIVIFGAYAIIFLSGKVGSSGLCGSGVNISIPASIMLTILVVASPFWGLLKDRSPRYGDARIFDSDPYSDLCKLVRDIDPDNSVMLAAVGRGRENMILRLLGYHSDTLGGAPYLGYDYSIRTTTEEEYFRTLTFPFDPNKTNYLIIGSNARHHPLNDFVLGLYPHEHIKTIGDIDLYLLSINRDSTPPTSSDYRADPEEL